MRSQGGMLLQRRGPIPLQIDSHETLRLRPVTVTQAMTTAVEQGMTQASAWTHDQAPALSKPPPTAADLKAALDQLDTFVAQFKN